MNTIINLSFDHIIYNVYSDNANLTSEISEYIEIMATAGVNRIIVFIHGLWGKEKLPRMNIINIKYAEGCSNITRLFTMAGRVC